MKWRKENRYYIIADCRREEHARVKKKVGGWMEALTEIKTILLNSYLLLLLEKVGSSQSVTQHMELNA